MSRSSGSRTAILPVVVVAVLGVCGLVLYRNGTLERLLARDSENPEEVAQLREAPPAPPAVVAASVGWPQFLGPTRDGRAPDGPFRTDWDKTAPARLWTVPVGGGFSSFAVVGGKLYTQDRQGDSERVVCLDAATGAPLWEHAYPADYGEMGYAVGPRATPTVEGNRVYTVGATGLFLCLEAPSAPGLPPRVVWQHDLPREFDGRAPQWGYACSPLLDGDRVIVQAGGRKGSVVAFDKAGGEVRWTAGTNPAGYSSPTVTTAHGVRVIYALTGDALLCLRDDGTVMGTYSWPTQFTGNIATPVVLDDYVFVSAAYGAGCALLRVKPAGDRVTLEPVYAKRNKPLRTHHSTAVAVGRHLYGFDTEGGRLVCFSVTDGTEVEGWDAAGVRKGSLIAAGRHLVILSQTGELILAEATPEEYRPLASIPLGFAGQQNWAHPALADGRLYVRGPDQVVCLDVRP